MLLKNLKIILWAILACASPTSFATEIPMSLPHGFVYLEKIDPSILLDLKYLTHDNFMGRPIQGYVSKVCILTEPTALALAKVQQALKPLSLGLMVYDCYRPQTAVNDFIAWSQDSNDQKMKAAHYPNINKADFFKLGYVAAKSGHTRGSTVDLTLVTLEKGKASKELVMGTQFDYMDPLSHTFAKAISPEAQKNRLLLRDIMQKNGFEPYDQEWWHFTLKQEPFPDTYFDFPIR